MELECTCGTISADEVEKLCEGSKPINYKWLVGRIRTNMPDLYAALSLNLFNPWWQEASVTKTHYILVHSAIDYFIRKK